jgi:hypothetical protein
LCMSLVMKMNINRKKTNCNAQHKIGQAQIGVSLIISVHHPECT